MRKRSQRTGVAVTRDKAALRQTERQLAFALESARMGTWELDAHSGRLTSSAGCRDLYGLRAEDPFDTHEDVIALVHPEDRAPRARAIADAIRNKVDLEMEYRVVKPNGAIVWLLARGRAEYEGERWARIGGVVLDITSRKTAESRQQLLLDELNHRVKNTLATVQSLVLQTRRTVDRPQDFDVAFLARVEALARAHDLLVETVWAGVSLAEMVALNRSVHLSPAEADRLTATGPPVKLDPNAAVILNMAFHELATNAVKHGALNAANGRIDVTWWVDLADNPTLRIEWRESGGVGAAAPSRRGFGSRLIEQAVPHELGGEARLVFSPDGLTCEMNLPLTAKISLGVS